MTRWHWALWFAAGCGGRAVETVPGDGVDVGTLADAGDGSSGSPSGAADGASDGAGASDAVGRDAPAWCRIATDVDAGPQCQHTLDTVGVCANAARPFLIDCRILPAGEGDDSFDMYGSKCSPSGIDGTFCCPVPPACR